METVRGVSSAETLVVDEPVNYARIKSFILTRDVVLLARMLVPYLLAASIARMLTSRPPLVGAEVYVWPFVLALLLVPAGAVLYNRALLIRSRSPGFLLAYRESWQTARRGILRPHRLIEFAALGALTVVLMSTVSGIKQMIPAIQPRSLDPWLHGIERMLHGGVEPWRLLEPVLRFPLAVRFLDVVYFVLWFQVVWAVWIWQTWSESSAFRTRYLATFVLTWIVLGSVLATLCYSGGPAFYGRLVPGPDPYAPLIHRLGMINASSKMVGPGVLNWLWYLHAHRVSAVGGGISAMPSLHVAMAELCAIVGRARSRGYGIVLTAFAVLIFVGSVILSPHYAIDGYVAIILVHVIWRATKGVQARVVTDTTRPRFPVVLQA